MPLKLIGAGLVDGRATGDIVYSEVPLSFWGGIDPVTGTVIDTHHPLHGQTLTGKILAIPSGRGSCSGTGTMLEMLLGGTGPAALVVSHPESILTLGVLIAREFYQTQIPVLLLDPVDFEQLETGGWATVQDGSLIVHHGRPSPSWSAGSDHPGGCHGVTAAGAASDQEAHLSRPGTVALSELDRQLLDGAYGEAARVAMRIVLRAAELAGATELIDVERAHIDGVFYQGPASLAYAEKLVELGGKVRVPSTMNAICVDRQRWRAQGVSASIGEPSERLADAYEQLGVQPTYTCAPYLLRDHAKFGEQIASAESNAVVYANSVVGARTMKYPDYLDILIALTGRSPKAGPHLDAERLGTVLIDVESAEGTDDAYFATLGYHLGKLAPNDIPVIRGLEDHAVSAGDLKGFGAAFATMSAAPMFHIVGVTPEAETVEQATGGAEPRRRFVVSAPDLAATWAELSTATDECVDLVALGNPHLSLAEIAQVAHLVQGRTRGVGVQLLLTCGREVYQAARRFGYVEQIESFGGQVINDACWCFIGEPIIPPAVRTIATNSGKFAHYGAGSLGRGMHLRSLAECVDAACTGQIPARLPRWL